MRISPITATDAWWQNTSSNIGATWRSPIWDNLHTAGERQRPSHPDRPEPPNAFAVCAGTEEAIVIRDDIGCFQAVKAALAKPRGPRKTTEELDYAVRQLVAKAIAPEGEIIDVFQAAGLKQPDISTRRKFEGRMQKEEAPEFLIHHSDFALHMASFKAASFPP